MMKMMMMMMMMMIVTINNIVGVFFGTYRRGLDDPEPVAARPPPPGLDALVGLAGLGLALVGHNKRWERRLAATWLYKRPHCHTTNSTRNEPNCHNQSTAQKTNQLPHKQQHKKTNPIATINQQRTIKQQQ
jgi:hypothetical protein